MQGLRRAVSSERALYRAFVALLSLVTLFALAAPPSVVTATLSSVGFRNAKADGRTHGIAPPVSRKGAIICQRLVDPSEIGEDGRECEEPEDDGDGVCARHCTSTVAVATSTAPATKDDDAIVRFRLLAFAARAPPR
jgi:hypothetical protein